MSIYGINKFFRTCLHDKSFRALAISDPDAALQQMPLTEEERNAMRRGDVRWLYEHGAHAFLLSFLTRWNLFGVDVAHYSTSIQQARDWRKDAPG